MYRLLTASAALAALLAASCGGGKASVFKDDATANATPAVEQLDLTFVDTEGRAVSLLQYRGKKHVVLVVTRGYSGRLCPYCGAQVSSLIAKYDEFARRDAEVLVVFPGPSEQAGPFVRQARSDASDAEVRFPVLRDENLKAVDRLGIRGDLAKPATYVIAKDGRVPFAYVGASPTDRPSVKRLLRALDDLKAP